MDFAPLLLTAIFAPMGAGMIWLGRKGQTGQIDFAMSKYNRTNTTPQSWKAAHQATGKGIIRSGAAFVIGSLVFPIVHNMSGEIPAVVVLMAVTVVATALALAAAFRGLKVLGEPDARPDGMTRST